MRRVGFAVLVSVLAAGLAAGAALGGPLAQPTWSSIIAWFNPTSSADDTGLSVVYFRDDGTSIPSAPIEVKAHSSGTLYIGSILHNQDFEGSAVLSANMPVLAVYKQVAGAREAYSPILYNSFDLDMAGSTYYLPFVQRERDFNSQIGIQNVEPVNIDVKLTFYDSLSGNSFVYQPDADEWYEIPPQSTWIFRLSDIDHEEMNNGFSGAVVISGRLTDEPVTPGRVVAVVKDMQAAGRRAYAYEGVNGGEDTIFLPSAFCEVGSNKMTTRYVVQNLHASEAASVSIVFYDGENGNTADPLATLGPVSINAGYNAIFDACDSSVADAIRGKKVSAVATSAGGQPLGAVGNVISDDGLLTAFTALRMQTVADGEGIYRMVFPYVEWSTSKKGYRTTITVMNLGGANAVNMRADYYGNDGSPISVDFPMATDTSPLLPYAIRNSSAVISRAVDMSSNGFTGAVIISSDQPIAAVAHVERAVDVDDYATLGEDYSGIPYVP
jgi:hypothetical protein